MLPVIAKHFTQRGFILLADRFGQRVCGLSGWQTAAGRRRQAATALT
jgi:hypothetical protein